MPRLILQVEGKKLTTRDGNHEDDRVYFQQQKEQIQLLLTNMGFTSKVSLEIER